MTDCSASSFYELDDLIYYFMGANKLLELINSDWSYTITDESIMRKKDEWNNDKKLFAQHYILGYH